VDVHILEEGLCVWCLLPTLALSSGLEEDISYDRLWLPHLELDR